MARVSRERRECYDNIQLGGGIGIITTRERTIPDQTGAVAGALPPAFTTWGNTENIQFGVDYGEELSIKAGTALMEGERLG